jgi:prevent-host-death family protein
MVINCYPIVIIAAPKPEPITIAAGKFKARCLKLMDEANATQRAILITKRGRPVGQFVPATLEEEPFARHQNPRRHHLSAPAGVDLARVGVGEA